MKFELYNDQQWPESGRHILAHYDDESVVVYQAFKPEIGHFAADYGHFGDEFSLNRMTWVKTSFLWIMHRSGWATKEDQEVILAIWMDRGGFDAILKKAVISSFEPGIYVDEDQWQRAISVSSVRLQWDPDYNPAGGRLERRAIQVGLRGKSAVHYAQGGWITKIEDITDFVRQQYQNAKKPYDKLLLPRQRVYPVEDSETARRLGL